MDEGFGRRHEKVRFWRLNGNIDGKSGLDNYFPSLSLGDVFVRHTVLE